MSLCGLHEWITGAFPDIIQKVPQDKVPAQTFDHVFIDMQHVIVNSSKSINNNEITNLFIPNHDVIDYCLHYIETIFTLFRPTKLFYIAMQGVEPQAAAIRTRKNAYLTAQRTSQLKVKLFAARMDSQIPPNVFDPNSVHAGSSFMLELQRNIEYWIVDKINSDSDWQNLDVFLSGHDVPGESKQKIVSYLRQEGQKADKTSKFAIFSEDAETIVLSSCLKSLDVHILFTDSTDLEINPERKTYQKLPIKEFGARLTSNFRNVFETSKCNITLDTDRLCADFALLCHLSGSSYFPQIPLLFNRNCLEPVLNCYKACVPSMKDYLITHDKKVNFVELCEFFDKLSLLEGKVFEHSVIPKMLKYRSELIANKGYSHEDAQLRARRDIYGFVYDLRPFPEDSNVALEFSNYRIGFYKYKLKFTEDHEVRKSGMGLLKTLCWIMDSTLSHVPSWDWAYPFDYGPMISDITGIANCSFRFPPDTPLTNFAYLMYVLPPESQNLLPEPLRPEITKEDRVEIDCVHFEDQKKFTILIPHRKIEPVEKFLESKLAEVSESDRLRNDRGVRKMYRSEEYEQEIFRSLLNSRHFPDICPCFVSVKIIPGEKLMVTDGQVMTSEHSFKEHHLEFQRSSTSEPEVTGVLPLRPNLLPPPPTVFMPQTDNRFVPRNFVPGGIRHVPPVDNSFDRKLSNSGPPRSMLAGYKGGFGHG